MNAPSLRTLAVAAGFLGLSLIVAGTATAMIGSSPDQAIGSSISLSKEESATPTPTPSAGAPLLPGTPIEIGRDPLLTCDEEGTCGEGEADAAARDALDGAASDGAASDGAASDGAAANDAAGGAAVETAEEAADAEAAPNGAAARDSAAADSAPQAGHTAAARAAGVALAGCDLPAKPQLDGPSPSERRAAISGWTDALVAAAHDCGVDLNVAVVRHDGDGDALMKAWSERRPQRTDGQPHERDHDGAAREDAARKESQRRDDGGDSGDDHRESRSDRSRDDGGAKQHSGIARGGQATDWWGGRDGRR